MVNHLIGKKFTISGLRTKYENEMRIKRILKYMHEHKFKSFY
jgi:hypothetical protein